MIAVAVAVAVSLSAQYPVVVGDMRISAKQLRHWERIATHNDSLDPRPPARQAASLLIEDRWVRGEARRRDVRVTAREVQDALEAHKQHAYPDEADFRAYLRQSGQTEADVRFRIRTELYAGKLRGEQEHDAFEAALKARWKPRTRCARRYFVRTRCRAR